MTNFNKNFKLSILITMFSVLLINPLFSQTWTNYTTENTGSNPIGDANMRDLLEDNSNNIWFCNNANIAKYDGTNWTIFTTDDGLISNTTNVIYEDNANNLWFGTGNGISKYNGTNFTNYTSDDGLVYNNIDDIVQDNAGNMWIGTNDNYDGSGGGISKFDGTNWTNYTTSNSDLPHNDINVVFNDNSNNLWFGTENGLAKFDGTTWTVYTTADGLVNDTIYSVIEDNANNIWIGTKNGVSKYDGTTFTNYTNADGLVDNKVNEIYQDNVNNFWFATPNGISKYNGSTWTTYTILDGLSNNNVYNLMQDHENNMWFGTQIGANKFDGSIWTEYSTYDGGLVDNNVWSSVVDNNDNIWFSGFYGVTRFDGTSWQGFRETDGMSDNYFWTMVKDNQGNIWFPSTGNNNVTKYDGTSFTIYTMPGSFEECSYIDKDGNIWFGSWVGDGAVKYDGSNWTVFNDALIQDGTVLSIADDNDGNMYFATFNGVIKYDGTTYSELVLPTTLKSNINIDIPHLQGHHAFKYKEFKNSENSKGEYVSELFKDSQGNLWITTYNAYYKYNGTDFTTFTADDGINLRCEDIAEDSQGNIYFAGGNVVDIYNGTSWSSYTNANGLAQSGSIYSLSIDNNDNLYVGYYGKGIYFYDSPTSINKVENNLSVFPNPTNGIINIDLDNISNNINVEIFNLTGQTVYKNRFYGTNSVQLDISNQNSEIYFIKLQADNYSSSFKIIKK